MATTGSVTNTSRDPVRPTPWRVWLQAVRIFSFTASVIPILVGSALAIVERSFHLPLFVAMVVASIACHAGANLANDYFDHARGIDTPESLGPSKVIQQGLLSPTAVRNGMLVAFAFATIVGLAIVAAAGWQILVLALASLAAAYFYTGGPKPLGYVALGELTVFVFMGPVMVGGAFYVLTETITRTSLLVSIPIGLLVAAILHANNIRDIDLDRAAGKVTLATIFGRNGANLEYRLLVGGAYLAIISVVVNDGRLWPSLVVFLTLPTAVALIRLVCTAPDAPTLNVVLRRTAGLHLRFGVLTTVGLLLAAIIDRVR